MSETILKSLLLIFFLTTASLAAAQPAKKVPQIGFFDAGTFSSASLRIEAFRFGLRELGYVEGRKYPDRVPVC
jgi:putative ABC transport system substrate-binding protein